MVIGTLALKHVTHRKQAVTGYSVVWCILAFALLLPIIDPVLASEYHGRALVGLLCIAMGIHSAIVRIHGLPDLATILMTMTLTAFVSETILLSRAHQRWRRRLLSIALFVASGILCATLVTNVDPYAGLALALLLLTLAIPCLGREKPQN